MEPEAGETASPGKEPAVEAAEAPVPPAAAAADAQQPPPNPEAAAGEPREPREEPGAAAAERQAEEPPAAAAAAGAGAEGEAGPAQEEEQGEEAAPDSPGRGGQEEEVPPQAVAQLLPQEAASQAAHADQDDPSASTAAQESQQDPADQRDGTSALLAPVGVKAARPQFLERLKHPSAQGVVNEVRSFVGQFPANLTRPQAARRIHGFLSSATPGLLQTEAFRQDAPEDASDLAMEGLEKFVVLKLYKLLFRHAPADIREDEHVESCIQKARPNLPPPQLGKDAMELFNAAAVELQKVDQYRAPHDKAVCMLNAYRLAEGAVAEDAQRRVASRPSDAPDAEDALRRLLPTLVVRAAPPHFFSNLEFTAAFRHPSRVTAEERRCFRDFAVALAAVTGTKPPRRPATDTAAIAPADSGLCSVASLGGQPAWLVDAGVTFHFEGRAAGELKLGEVDELLDEYHGMVRALRELAGLPSPQKGAS